MIVAKFGGTSVSSRESILTICEIVKNQKNLDLVVVVSALSGITDLLLSLPSLPKYKFQAEIRRLKNTHKELINKVFKDPKEQKRVMQFVDEKVNEILKLNLNNQKKTLDKLCSFGEIISSYIVANALDQNGIKSFQVLATDLIVTNDNFGSADFILEPTKRNVKSILTPIIKRGIVPVVTGFIGSTTSGQVTTLGRGGSDYTASIIGFCLGVKEIQIWTDVDGMFTADPRLVTTARSLPVVSFKEAAEMATFGARVLHPRTIHPAIKAGIPVRVLNTFNPKSHGTLIIKEVKTSKAIRSISFKRKITLVNIYSTEMLLQRGFLARVFKIFGSNDLSIDLVSVSEVSISVSLDNDGGLVNAVKQLSSFTSVSIIKDLGMVSLIGEGVTSSSQTIKKIFDILDKEQILVRMVSLGATNINISLVIESDKVEKAVKVLHERLLFASSGIIASK
ncbi:aspartate kinase [Candidatus Daviesbacteria bacterium]|nr:aspartate kinase [Candidatus Daviesbacteria bacterium]